MTENNTLICSLCDADIIAEARAKANPWEGGHNPEPLSNGRCCDVCNDEKVIPARINELMANGLPKLDPAIFKEVK